MRMGVLGNSGHLEADKTQTETDAQRSAQEGVAYFATIMLKQKVNMKNCKIVHTRRPLGASLSITLP